MISSQEAQMVQENPGSVSLEIMTLRKRESFYLMMKTRSSPHVRALVP